MTKNLKKAGCLLFISLGIIGIVSSLWLFSDNMERRIVTVGFFEYPPYNMIDPKSGKPTGFCVDILEAVAKKQNLEIKYINTPFTDYESVIPKGTPYVMGLPIIITPERQRICNFSWPCDENTTTFFIKKSSPKKKDINLKKCIVGSPEGVEGDYCKKLREAGKIKNYIMYSSPEKLREALITDKVDIILIDRGIALYFQALYPDTFELIDSNFLKQCEYKGFPVQKKQEWLLKRLNNGLRRIINSSEYSRIYHKYFSNGEN